MLEDLIQLETELHRLNELPEARVKSLLHDEFMEIGRSGKIYSKQAMLDSSRDHPQPYTYTVSASEYSIQHQTQNSVLLTYRSFQHWDDGTSHNYALRSSLWVASASGWALRFHQATPLEMTK